jgi:hypothetical protein
VVNPANNSSAYEAVYLNAVPLRKPNKSPSLLCVARKMAGPQLSAVPQQQLQQQQQQQQLQQQQQQQMQQQQQTVGISTGPADLFSTRLDPTSFRILHSETDKAALSSRSAAMTGKCFLEFCHPEDQELIRAHFLETLQGNNGSVSHSKPYRMVGLLGVGGDPQRVVRVQTRSRCRFQESPFRQKSFPSNFYPMRTFVSTRQNVL